MSIDHRADARHPIRRLRRTVVALLASLLLAVPASAAAAAANGALTIRGTQLAYGTCGPNSDGYRMTGDLDGCWWITDFTSTTDASRHNVRATGTELFVGWLGSRYGSFTTTFEYTAKMDGPWMTSPEVHGRCHHPIVEGDGDFAGITGELSFHDVVDVDPPYYPYWGNLRIAGQDISLGGTGTTTRAGGPTSASTSASTNVASSATIALSC